MDEMKNLPAELVAFQAKMKKNSGFVPFVKHQMMPTAQPVRGAANDNLAEAEGRVRECLANPIFTAGWVVSNQSITEVK
jgi:hypothetical protein